MWVGGVYWRGWHDTELDAGGMGAHPVHLG